MAIGGLSNTFDFAPGLGELGAYAFGLAGIRRAEMTQEHMWSLRMAANMLLQRWSGQTPNLWSVDLITTTLVPGQATYDVDPSTVMILDAYIVQGSGAGQINRLIMPVSRSEYAGFPQPQQQGAVTVYWFDRLLAPTITLYFVPDSSQPELQYYRVRRAMDADLTNGQQVEVPGYWLEAFAFGLAQRLAILWKPERAAGLKALADEAYEIAASQNVENANTFVSVLTAGYWRP